jgi:lipoprotein-releasing system permease protein
VSNNLFRSFAVIIVALGISSMLGVSVVHKQREILILRAMGAGRRRIMAIFLLQGGVAGSALAYGLLVVFSHVFKSPDGSAKFGAQLDPMLVLLAPLVACGGGHSGAQHGTNKAGAGDQDVGE